MCEGGVGRSGCNRGIRHKIDKKKDILKPTERKANVRCRMIHEWTEPAVIFVVSGCSIRASRAVSEVQRAQDCRDPAPRGGAQPTVGWAQAPD